MLGRSLAVALLLLDGASALQFRLPPAVVQRFGTNPLSQLAPSAGALALAVALAAQPESALAAKGPKAPIFGIITVEAKTAPKVDPKLVAAKQQRLKALKEGSASIASAKRRTFAGDLPPKPFITRSTSKAAPSAATVAQTSATPSAAEFMKADEAAGAM